MLISLLPEGKEARAEGIELEEEAAALQQEAEAEAAETRNPAQDKPLSKGEIEKLKKRGVDPHELKENRKGTDLYKDRKGNIYEKPKGSKGPGDPKGININDF